MNIVSTFFPNLVHLFKNFETLDIYSLGILTFEILSNLDSPWENVASFLSDCMIKDAVAKG